MLLLILLCAVGSGLTQSPVHEDIEDFAVDLYEFEQDIADMVDQYTGLKADAVHIIIGLDDLQGSGCDDRFQMQCGGIHPVCVSRLLICDQKSDCPNGRDEAQCDVLVPVGSKWKGTFTYDVCPKRRPAELAMTINKYNIPIELLAFPEIEATVSMYDEAPQFSYNVEFILNGVMDIKPGVHLMYFSPPESDGLALQCTFDGVVNDHCHGEIIHSLSGFTCAEFFMQRL